MKKRKEKEEDLSSFLFLFINLIIENLKFFLICCVLYPISLTIYKKVHRLVIVDNENRVQGIISLSDILTYIILKQSEDATHDSKTKTLTSTFGLTRLSSNIDSMPSSGRQSSSSIGVGTAAAAGTAASRVSPSPMTISNSNLASTNQRTSSAVDQAIFEDDPMET